MRARIQAHSEGQLTSNVWAMLQTQRLSLNPETKRLTANGNRLQMRLTKQTAKSTMPKLVRKARMNGFVWIERVEHSVASNQVAEKRARTKKAKSPLVLRQAPNFETFMETQRAVRNLSK